MGSENFSGLSPKEGKKNRLNYIGITSINSEKKNCGAEKRSINSSHQNSNIYY
jgi:hypothetical protein